MVHNRKLAAVNKFCHPERSEGTLASNR